MKKVLVSILFGLMFQKNIQATINLTTVSPNTFVGGFYIFDLNFDGINDFKIKNGSFNTVTIECLHSAAMIQVNSGNAVPFSNNSIIGANTWLSSPSISMSQFYGQSRYLGLKINVGSDSFYGWALMDIPSDGSHFTIFYHAYEDVTNSVVKAGQSESDAIGRNFFLKD